MKFEWDEEKNLLNFEKHGVWFEEAQTVWIDSLALEFYDSDHSENEDRFIRVGVSQKLNFLLIVFCEFENEKIRIISARRTTKKEREQFEEGI